MYGERDRPGATVGFHGAPPVAGRRRELIVPNDDFAPWAGRESEIGLRQEKAPSHPNAKGDDLMARWIARELRARGLVPR